MKPGRLAFAIAIALAYGADTQERAMIQAWVLWGE